ALATLALAARADDDASHELKLVPAARKGQEETLELEAQIERPSKAGGRAGDTLKATVRRRVRKLDAEGLPLRETLVLEKADLAHFEATRTSTSSRQSTGTGAAAQSFSIERT